MPAATALRRCGELGGRRCTPWLKTHTSNSVDLLNHLFTQDLSGKDLRAESLQVLSSRVATSASVAESELALAAPAGAKIVEQFQDDVRMKQVVFDLVPAPDEALTSRIAPAVIRGLPKTVIPILDRNSYVLRRRQAAFEIMAYGAVALASTDRFELDSRQGTNPVINNQRVEDTVIQSPAWAFANEIDDHYSAPVRGASPRSPNSMTAGGGNRTSQVRRMSGCDDLISLPQTRNQVDKRPLPERMLIQFQFINEHHGLMHAFSDEADQQQQNVLLAAAQTSKE